MNTNNHKTSENDFLTRTSKSFNQNTVFMDTVFDWQFSKTGMRFMFIL